LFHEEIESQQIIEALQYRYGEQDVGTVMEEGFEKK